METLFLGRRPYTEVWELQRSRQHALIEGERPEVLIFCEHNPVITLGKASDSSNVRVSRDELGARGVEVHEVERGGDVTFHGPGQAVMYPILDLRTRKRDVGWYMRQLEEVVIRTLQDFEILGVRVPGKTGVWIADSGQTPGRKIASLGVRISRWCTMHGVALNVGSVPGEFSLEDGFSLIHPCGFKEIQVTSLAKELRASTATMEQVFEHLARHFVEVLSTPHQEITARANSCKALN